MDYTQNDINEISNAFNVKIGLLQASSHKVMTEKDASLSAQLKEEKQIEQSKETQNVTLDDQLKFTKKTKNIAIYFLLIMILLALIYILTKIF